VHEVIDADAAGRERVREPDPGDVVSLVCSVRRPIDGPSLDELVDQPDRSARFERELRGRQASGCVSQAGASLRGFICWLRMPLPNGYGMQMSVR
jgi:hypothetical protein